MHAVLTFVSMCAVLTVRGTCHTCDAQLEVTGGFDALLDGADRCDLSVGRSKKRVDRQQIC